MLVNKKMGETSKNFMDEGCCVVRNILDKDLCDFLNVNMELASITETRFNAGPVVPGSIELYSTPALQIAHDILLNKVRDFLKPERLFSTYSFYRKYYKYQELPRHYDRKECEISLSICLGMTDTGNPWSFYCENLEKNSIYEGILQVGDGIIYAGEKLYHWREKCEQNWVKQAFFHFSPNRELEFDQKRNPTCNVQRDLIKLLCENL
jgi:hypothetical protein